MIAVVILLVWILVLSLVFALLEINIEGKGGWAADLPTWRIEDHPLLDIFWGGRALTGYHVWAFLFVALVFHMPVFMTGIVSLKLEARIFGSLMLFWVTEDFLWFVMNPHFGIRKFRPEDIPWHKRWILGLPVDYWIFMIAGTFFVWYSFTGPGAF